MSKSNGADRGPPIEWYDIEWTSKLKARWQRWVMGVDRNQLTAAERVVAFWLADHVNTDPMNEGFGTAWPSWAALVADCDLNRTTIATALKKLTKRKFIYVMTEGEGTRRWNRYFLTKPPSDAALHDRAKKRRQENRNSRSKKSTVELPQLLLPPPDDRSEISTIEAADSEERSKISHEGSEISNPRVEIIDTEWSEIPTQTEYLEQDLKEQTHEQVPSRGRDDDRFDDVLGKDRGAIAESLAIGFARCRKELWPDADKVVKKDCITDVAELLNRNGPDDLRRAIENRLAEYAAHDERPPTRPKEIFVAGQVEDGGDECHGPNSVNRTETSAQRDRPFWGPTLPR